MSESNRNTSMTHEVATLKNRVSKNRSRAQMVGFTYLFALLMITIMACLPLFDLTKQPEAPVGVFAFWRVFSLKNLKSFTQWSGVLPVVNASLYALMLLVLAINVIRAFTKLEWLYKQKVSKTFGLNRNVYAMEDLGKLFSASFAFILTIHFLIAILCGQAHFNRLMCLLISFGVIVHLIAGFIGGKVSYFVAEGTKIVEDARTISRIPALIRNVLQLVVVFVAMYYFQKISTIHTVIGPLLEKNGYQNHFINCEKALSAVIFQAITFVCLIPLIFHATGLTEYNIDGVYGPGMKTFRIFSLFAFVAMAASAVIQYYFGQVAVTMVDGVTVIEIVKTLGMEKIILAFVAFLMFLVELFMRKMPGQKGKKKRRDESDDKATDSSVVLYIYNN